MKTDIIIWKHTKYLEICVNVDVYKRQIAYSVVAHRILTPEDSFTYVLRMRRTRKQLVLIPRGVKANFSLFEKTLILILQNKYPHITHIYYDDKTAAVSVA